MGLNQNLPATIHDQIYNNILPEMVPVRKSGLDRLGNI